MAKMIDITEKLNFEQKPQIKIKDDFLTVNDEATVMLEIMPIIEKDSSSSADIYRVCKMLFSDEDFKKIEKLHLNFKDFTTLVKTAITLVTGKSDDDSGEEETHATT